jgi:hypothetical protein
LCVMQSSQWQAYGCIGLSNTRNTKVQFDLINVYECIIS